MKISTWKLDIGNSSKLDLRSKFRRCILALSLALMPAVSVPAESEIESRIVEVMVSFQENDPLLPWQITTLGTREGYGIVVDGRWVVTTESLVRNSRLVEIRRPEKGEKISAIVEMSDYQINLALLKIVGDEDFDESPSIEFADNFSRDARLRILQFDSTAQLQRIDAVILQVAVAALPNAPYQSLTFSLLTDATVNSEGAAVAHDGKLAGLVMRYDVGTRTAAMLPASVLKRFLTDAAESPYEGFAVAGFRWAPLIDPAKRDYLGVKEPGKGVVILSCVPGASAREALKPDDVILELDGYSIDNMGYYSDSEFDRLNFSHLIKGRHRVDDTVSAKLIRNRREMVVNFKLCRLLDDAAMIPENVTGEPMEYIVEGGFLIQELSGRYLRSHGADWMRTVDPRLVHLYLTRHQGQTRLGQRVLILSDILPDQINVGYQRHFNDQVITAVNGQQVDNMADVFRVIAADGSLKRLRLKSIGVEIVIDQNELDAANARIAEMYRIPKLRYHKDEGAQSAAPGN